MNDYIIVVTKRYSMGELEQLYYQAKTENEEDYYIDTELLAAKILNNHLRSHGYEDEDCYNILEELRLNQGWEDLENEDYKIEIKKLIIKEV